MKVIYRQSIKKQTSFDIEINDIDTEFTIIKKLEKNIGIDIKFLVIEVSGYHLFTRDSQFVRSINECEPIKFSNSEQIQDITILQIRDFTNNKPIIITAYNLLFFNNAKWMNLERQKKILYDESLEIYFPYLLFLELFDQNFEMNCIEQEFSDEERVCFGWERYIELYKKENTHAKIEEVSYLQIFKFVNHKLDTQKFFEETLLKTVFSDTFNNYMALILPRENILMVKHFINEHPKKIKKNTIYNEDSVILYSNDTEQSSYPIRIFSTHVQIKENVFSNIDKLYPWIIPLGIKTTNIKETCDAVIKIEFNKTGRIDLRVLHNDLQPFFDSGLFCNIEQKEKFNEIHCKLFRYNQRDANKHTVIFKYKKYGIKIVIISIGITFFKEIEILFHYMEEYFLEIKSEEIKSQKNVSDLKSFDPELYNNTVGSKPYSRIVEKKKEPEIISKEEFDSTKIPKHSKCKFINVTTGKPAYYSCHNNKHGNNQVYFLTGSHENDYCLPSCRPYQKERDYSVIDNRTKQCLKHFKYIDHQTRKKTNFYVPRSISKVREGSIVSVLKKDAFILKENINMFLLRVDCVIGIFGSISRVLEISHENLLHQFSEYSKLNNDIYQTSVSFIEGTLDQKIKLQNEEEIVSSINKDLMYFVLCEFNISIHILGNNNILTFGPEKKNIFIEFQTFHEEELNYSPASIKEDQKYISVIDIEYIKHDIIMNHLPESLKYIYKIINVFSGKFNLVIHNNGEYNYGIMMTNKETNTNVWLPFYKEKFIKPIEKIEIIQELPKFESIKKSEVLMVFKKIDRIIIEESIEYKCFFTNDNLCIPYTENDIKYNVKQVKLTYDPIKTLIYVNEENVVVGSVEKKYLPELELEIENETLYSNVLSAVIHKTDLGQFKQNKYTEDIIFQAKNELEYNPQLRDIINKIDSEKRTKLANFDEKNVKIELFKF